MIGDYKGCLDNSSWADWYEPYFEFINNESYGIQGFSYINSNNAQINECIPPQSNVGPLYQQTISKYTSLGLYFSNMNETQTKERLGLL